ncbi:MAG: hypothetical protein HUK17_06865 [Bacteroidales bacterium]|nr:hypothetical protein [Bacteroidales bacterium]
MCTKDNIRKRVLEGDDDEVYFISDFTTNGNDAFISRVLSELVNEGVLDRLGLGIYFRPIQTKFGILKPSIDSVTHAIARRDHAQILPTGETAENMLGLSTQVPMNYQYLTSGSARVIKLDGREIKLRRCTPGNFAYQGELMPILVQAMKSIGENNITPEHTSRIAELMKECPENDTYEHDIALAPYWIKRILRQIRKQL